MNSKNIKSVVASQEILEFGGVIASRAADHAVNDGRPRRNIARTRRNGDQTGHHARAKADSGPLTLQPVIHNAPGHAADASGKVCHDGGHDGSDVGAERRARVEAEPAHPQEHGADNDVGDVVRAVVELLGAVAAALAEHIGVGERGGAAGYVHWGAPSEVQSAEVVRPARWVPGPARDGIVHDRRPDEHVDYARKHAAAFGNGSNGEDDT